MLPSLSQNKIGTSELDHGALYPCRHQDDPPGDEPAGAYCRQGREGRAATRCPVTASTPEPEGGARCVSSARRDLCGGRGEILVPTATICEPLPSLLEPFSDGGTGQPGPAPCVAVYTN